MLKKADIQDLLNKPWKTIVVSGGKLCGDMLPSDNPNITLGIMLIQLDDHWVSIGAPEVPFGPGRDDYNFLIEISESIFPLEPELAKRNNPRLDLVNEFPQNCRLDYLREFGVGEVMYDIHPKSFTRYHHDLTYDLLLSSPLYIRSKNGYLFTIEPSDDVWGFFEISMQPLENYKAKS